MSANNYLPLIDELLDGFGTDTSNPEWNLCAASAEYFISNYCYIYDADIGDWILFQLWDAPKGEKSQRDALHAIINELQIIAIKSRQIGMTWLVLAYALWLCIFKPIQSISLFSKRDDEAVYMLSSDRFLGMYERLPNWIKTKASISRESAHLVRFGNGSTIRAFPTTAGDSYTSTLAVVDEADLVPDLGRLLRSVKATVDAGGQLILLGRVDKSKPNSEFKKIYRAAKSRANSYVSLFLSWRAHPKRDEAWYEQQCRDAMENTGALDYVHEQYPATDIEALAPASLDKRIPALWLAQCYRPKSPLAEPQASMPDVPGIIYFRMRENNRSYCIGADCAEGLANSDDSTTYVVTSDTAEIVAILCGKFTPAVHADLTLKLSDYYFKAPVLVERNNHGHAFILYCQENGGRSRLAKGTDKQPGWLTTQKSKSLLYDMLAETTKNAGMIIHDLETYTQVASVETGSLEAPHGEYDDRAVGLALAVWEATQPPPPPSGRLPRVAGKYANQYYDRFRGK